MGHPSYSYDKELGTRYTFISKGKRDIKKVVEFTPTSIENVYNMGFGDLLLNGSVDDLSNSNNGDITKVLSTVISILKEFISSNPKIKIVFTGSTKERTRLYQRIIKMNFYEFSKHFIISGLIKTDRQYKEIVFEPSNEVEYFAFFIKELF